MTGSKIKKVPNRIGTFACYFQLVNFLLDNHRLRRRCANTLHADDVLALRHVGETEHIATSSECSVEERRDDSSVHAEHIDADFAHGVRSQHNLVAIDDELR